MNAIAYLIGAGSMTLGVEAAGFKVERVFETPGYSKNAQTWDLNRPEIKHEVVPLDWGSDVFSSLQGADLFYGNPPCSGLSSMTCSRITSPVNNCMRQWIRMVVKARPRTILLENAYQLSMPRCECLLADLANVLAENGYQWWTWRTYGYQIGTPQIRRRTFLCGCLDTIAEPSLLTLEDSVLNRKRMSIGIGPLLYDLMGVAPSDGLVKTRDGHLVSQHWYGETSPAIIELFETWYERLHQPWFAPKEYTRAVKQVEQGNVAAIETLKAGLPHYWKNCPKAFDGCIQMTRPAPTHLEQAMPSIAGGWKFLHPVDRRLMTMRELARMMGYPDDWDFHAYAPQLISQGIPARSARWAADRLARIGGLK